MPSSAVANLSWWRPTSPTLLFSICSPCWRSLPISMRTTWKPMVTTSASSSRHSSIFCSTCLFTAWRYCAWTIQRARDHARRLPSPSLLTACRKPRKFALPIFAIVQDRCIFTALVGVNGKTRKLEIVLNLPGLHNVQNALAAIAVCNELGVPDAAIVSALAGFQGRGPPFSALWRNKARSETTLPGRGVLRWSMITAIIRWKWRPPSRPRAAPFPAAGWYWHFSRIATPAPATCSRISSKCYPPPTCCC